MAFIAVADEYRSNFLFESMARSIVISLCGCTAGKEDQDGRGF